MSRIESFDDFLSTEQMGKNFDITPFPFRDDKSETGTLKWLNENFDAKTEASQSRMYTYRRHIALYKGIHYRHQKTRNDSRREYEYNPRKAKMVVNYVADMVDQRGTQSARLNVAFTAIPQSSSTKDENAAKAVLLLMKAKAVEIDFEGKQMNADQICDLYGTVFLYHKWDADIGELHPAFKKLKEIANPRKEYRVGDICVEALAPDRVYPQLFRRDWESVEEVDVVDWVHIEELKKDYPSKAKDISSNSRFFFDYETFEMTVPENQVMVRTWYHRPSKYLPKGAMIRYTDDVILEWTDYPYEHGKLPFIVDRDVIVPGELWGRSFITRIEQAQRFYNNIETSIARDYAVGSAPKWFMPKGACSITDLNNEATIVEYTGDRPPQYVVRNPSPGQALELQDRLDKKISRFSAVYDISRGEVPSGVTANSALRFLDEQESQRQVIREKRRKRRVLDSYKMCLEIMKQYYKDSDERIIKYLGEDNSFLIENFYASDFFRVYDLRLQNTSALPDTKTGKIAAIIDLNTATQTDPVFRRSEVINMLDLGLDESFVDQATAALKSARAILDRILKGEQVAAPQIWEDLIVHHTVLYREMQKPTFQPNVPEEIKAVIVERVKVLEALMWTRSLSSPKFKMQLDQLEYYPLLFELPQAEALMPPPSANAMQAPTGTRPDMNTSAVETLPGLLAQEGQQGE